MRSKTIGSINTELGLVDIVVGRYPSGNAICVVLVGADPECHCFGEDMLVFSTNLVPYGAELHPTEFNVKTWSENESVVQPMLQSGLFEDTGKWVGSGFVRSPIWRIKQSQNVPLITFI